jgi:hypothetical protein
MKKLSQNPNHEISTHRLALPRPILYNQRKPPRHPPMPFSQLHTAYSLLDGAGQGGEKFYAGFGGEFCATMNKR